MENPKSFKNTIYSQRQNGKTRRKKKQFFKENKTRPPSLKFMLVMLLALYMLGFGAATPVDPNSYRPAATRTNFRDVQYNPKLIDHIKDFNYINKNISTVHADHVGIQTFVHEIKYVIEDAEAGIDQSCQAIIDLTTECNNPHANM